MNSVLYLSVSPFETRIALRENSRLVSFRAERHRTSSAVGNLYKGRVTRVLPGMQAAFVDVGLGRDAFLYVREAGGILDDFSDIFPVDDGEELATAAAQAKSDAQALEGAVQAEVTAAQAAFQTAIDAIPADATGVKEVAAYVAAGAVFAKALDAIDNQVGCS